AARDPAAVERSSDRARPLAERATALAGVASTGSARAWLASARADSARIEGRADVAAAREAVDAWEAIGDAYALAVARFRAAEAGARRLGLSTREIEVLALVAGGLSNGEIAERLFITRKTAAVHVTHILDKLGVSNRVEAAMIAARVGLTGEDTAQTST